MILNDVQVFLVDRKFGDFLVMLEKEDESIYIFRQLYFIVNNNTGKYVLVEPSKLDLIWRSKTHKFERESKKKEERVFVTINTFIL